MVVICRWEQWKAKHAGPYYYGDEEVDILHNETIKPGKYFAWYLHYNDDR